MTSPTPALRMTSPMAMGGRYPRTSSIQVRIVGSIDKYRTLTSASPGPGVGTGPSSSRTVLSSTTPAGRSAKTKRRLLSVI